MSTARTSGYFRRATYNMSMIDDLSTVVDYLPSTDMDKKNQQKQNQEKLEHVKKDTQVQWSYKLQPF